MGTEEKGDDVTPHRRPKSTPEHPHWGVPAAMHSLAFALLVGLCLVGTAACGTNLRTSDATDPQTDDGAYIREHFQFLADKGLKGRAPGTEGESVAAEYLANELSQMSGVVPAGDDGSFFSKVPLVGTQVATAGELSVALSDATVLRGTYLNDFVTSTDHRPTSALPGNEASTVTVRDCEMVFVGHGIAAPEYGWDDYKGVDVKGKVLVMFTNQPQPTSEDPDRFGGKALTYYGRWTYKYEEGRRRGAAGVLLIHTNETAGYPFSVVLSSNSGEQVDNAAEVDSPLQMRGWISRDLGDKIATLHSASVDEWFASARSKDFKPIPLTTKLSLSAEYSHRAFGGKSVLAVLPGTTREKEVVVLSGHLDHLGVRNGNIYPGAVDNAIGAGMILSLARRFAKASAEGKRMQRSVLFMFPTAEESGLLGSAYYVQHPAFLLNSTVATINFDIGNVWGATHDIVVLGADKSELGDVVRSAAGKSSLAVTEDPTPSTGMFFRSDHFSFAKEGVPGVWIATGTDFVGQDKSYYKQMVEGYIAHDYHQPTDVYKEEMSMDGVLQQVDVAATTTQMLADSDRRLKCFNPNGTCM